jgi:hypothetical protein
MGNERPVAKSPEQVLLEEMLDRVREMARSGLYRDCAAIERETGIWPNFPLVREWFNDPLFCQQITELCVEARQALNATP